MSNYTKVPFYAKASLIFIGLFVFIGTLYLAKDIVVPIIYSIIIAILLTPMVDFLIRKKLNRVLAITTVLTSVSLITIVCIALLSSQLTVFVDTFPKLLDKFYETVNHSVIWLSNNFNISIQKSNAFIADTKAEIISDSRSAIGSTLSTIGSAMVVLILIPVYVFMILFYRPLLLDFIRKVFGEENLKEVNEVLNSSKKIIQKYLVALLLEAVIIAILNSVGLLILGIDYAIVIGIIGALLNVIPYIGGIVAVAIPMIVAFVTKSSLTDSFLVLGLYIIIQFIDNNYVLPKLVASKVRINALVSIIIVLVGGALWGVHGMFLSIPLTAILKVIFDRIDNLKPWGFLLGDTMPAIITFKIKK
jgi:predicted PurR-regulated permease PerM